MATLFDKLQQTLGQKEEAPSSMQRRLEGMLRTKTGKATTAAGPQASQLGEAAAIGEAREGIRGQQMTGRLQAQRLKTASEAQEQAIGRREEAGRAKGRMGELALSTQLQEQEAKIRTQEQMSEMTREEGSRAKMADINNRAEMGLQELAINRNISLDNIFSTYERSNKELGARRDAAELEQLGFQLALRDKEYLDEINRIAAVDSLENEIAYRNETAKLVWGEELNNYLNQIDFQKGQDVDNAEWAKQLAAIDLDSAREVARMSAESTSQSAIYTGIGTIATAGVKASFKEEE